MPDSVRATGGVESASRLDPGGSITIANVEAVVKKDDGHDLQLSNQDGRKDVSVPPKTPVVTFTQMRLGDLASGQKVFVLAHRDTDRQLVAECIVIRK